VRTLAITIFTFNVTFGAAWSVLVLYPRERLGMGALGFGLITTAMAAGGLLGTASYGWLERHVRLGVIMRGGLIIETLTHLALALTRWAWFALIIFVIFGAHAFIWGTTSTTVRQRAVPAQFQGRVSSVYLTGVVGGIVIGSALGGLVASVWGITAPFWFAFAGSALLVFPGAGQGWMRPRSSSRLGCVGSQPSASRVWALDEGWSLTKIEPSGP
jgi:predicted MFS family arabinose efflux permease